MSLATIFALFLVISPIWEVLVPGAAQRSRIFVFSFGSKTSTTFCEASC